MTRDEIVKLKGPELTRQVAIEIEAMRTARNLRPWFSWDASHEEIGYILSFISDEGNGLQIKFLNALEELTNPEHAEGMGDLWRGLMATPPPDLPGVSAGAGETIMLKRLWHFFVGHSWKEQWSFCPPEQASHYGLYSIADYHAAYGFMVWVRTCHCGASAQRKFVGKLSEINDDAELALLRKMAGMGK